MESRQQVLLGIRRFIIGLVHFISMSDYAVPLAFPVTKGVSIHPASNVVEELVGILQAIVKVLRPVRFPFSIRNRVGEELFMSTQFFGVKDVNMEPCVNVEDRFVRSCHVLTLPFKRQLFLHQDRNDDRSYRWSWGNSFLWTGIRGCCFWQLSSCSVVASSG